MRTRTPGGVGAVWLVTPWLPDLASLFVRQSPYAPEMIIFFVPKTAVISMVPPRAST